MNKRNAVKQGWAELEKKNIFGAKLLIFAGYNDK